MSTIKPPSSPSTQPLPDLSKSTEAQTNQTPAPRAPAGPVDQLEAEAPSRSATQLRDTTAGLAKPSSQDRGIPSITVSTVPDLSHAELDAFNPTPRPEDLDPNRLSVPIDTRLTEAKANLSTILEALGKHPQLETQHQELSTALEQLAQRQAQYRHQEASVTEPSTHQKTTSDLEKARIQSETEEIEGEITLLTEQLEILSDPVKHERLSAKARALLARLPSIPTIETDFQQAYTSFVRDFGEETAQAHNLTQNIEVLRHNVDVLKKNGEHLEGQRDHMKSMLEKPLSPRNLQRIERHIDSLAGHFERHAESVENFNKSTSDFVSFIDSLRDNKKAAQEERLYVTQAKTEMIGELDSILESSFDGTALQNAFARAQRSVGDQILETRGFTRNLEVLQHNLGNVQDSLHSVRSYAQMLKTDLEKADHRGWVDARKTNVAELKAQFADFQELKESYTSDLKGFLEDLSKLEAAHSRAPISEKKANLEAMLQALPNLIKTENLLEEHQAAIANQGGSLAEDAAQLNADFNTLNRSLSLLTKRKEGLLGKIQQANTGQAVQQAKEELNTLESLIKRHNGDTRTYQRLADRLLDKVPGLDKRVESVQVRPLSSNAKVLLDRIERGQSPLFDTLNITGLSYSDGRSLKFNTDDRIAVWDNLIEKNPTLDLNKTNQGGYTLIHQIILSAGLDEPDKVSMVQFLMDRGADVNIPSRDGLPPVELALRLSVEQPELIDTLRDGGAKLTLGERIPVLAHLIGAGGEVSLKTDSSLDKVALEGLSPRYAAYGLDPAFSDSLSELRERTHGPMNELYQRVERGWVNTMSYDKFIGRVRDAKIGVDTRDGVPEVLSTGWDHPSGHAISFVFNHEPDGYFFYACNTGDVKDPDRSIVKYQVDDFNAFLRFLKTASRDSDHTRSLYVDSAEPFGLRRVAEEDQLPSAIDKSSQKIGNCTVASRKAALLAMLWSENRDFNIEPKALKAGYKEVTTELRERGIRGAIESGHQELMGKALVKMLTKFDRPACQGYAYELASAMIRNSKGQDPVPAEGHPGKVPQRDNPAFEATLLEAVKLGKLNLRQRESNGETLAQYAKNQGNVEAAAILSKLARAA